LFTWKQYKGGGIPISLRSIALSFICPSPNTYTMFRTLHSILLIFCFCFSSLAQVDSYRPADLVKSAMLNDQSTEVPLFKVNNSRNSIIPSDIKQYDLLDLDSRALSTFLEENRSQFIEINIPADTRESLTLQLVKTNIHSGDAYVKTMPSEELVKVDHGIHYRGIVKGNSRSLVSISIYENEVMGFISERSKSNLVLGKLDGESTHILYEDNDLKDILGFACETPNSDIEYTEEELTEVGGGRALTDCVRIYFEVDYDIYLDKGSNVNSVTNFVTGLFNQVATMYANEQINVVLSPLTIWTQTSPYSSTSSSGMLNDFLANTGAFDGDLAQLLSYQASGGIAYVNGLCSSNPDYSKSFSSINSTYQNVPTYSWSVMVITHEFGHLFGSQHTHACAWNGNNTAIDGCYTTEGGCSDPGIPSGGGTVMSYCHLTSAGINLNLGFGPQPGNLIRNKVQNASCTQACDDGGGGGGGGGTTCTDTEATLTINLDNYPGETTWTLSNGAGSTLYSGGPYSTSGGTVTETFCLVDGCYDFQINDSYGDGICCGYGQGSYDISVNNQSVASGGQFASIEVVNFCIGDDNPPPATCNDGIQNGNETGVDCGGPDCDACVSCDDGIQNGNETGVDCGGPDCDACVSCNDGIQNGNETGVDCGGPDCDPCDNGGSNEVFAHYFESGWDGWTDGGVDCYRYSGSRSYEGNYSIRIRDNSGTNSAMTSSSYNLSGYTGVEVNFYFYPNSMESGEDFWVRYYDGSSWQTVATFASGSSFTNNNFYVATVPILSNQYNMANNARFRFQCDASGNADRIYIDAVTVTGLTSGSLIDGEIQITELTGIAETEQYNFIEDIQLSPNPAVDQLRLKINVDHDQEMSLEIVDILGRKVLQNKISLQEGTATVPVDINMIDTGTYFMKIIDSEGDVEVKKFIKLK